MGLWTFRGTRTDPSQLCLSKKKTKNKPLYPTWAASLCVFWSICGRHLQRSSVRFFLKHPQLSKGTSVQGHMTPHGVFYNQQSDVRSQARVFVTSKVFLHFLYRTELLVSLGCWLVTETFTFTLRGATPTRSRRGDYLIMALFSPSYLPKCCRYEHDGKYLYSWVTCVVYNVWHTFTKNRDLFLIFKTRKWET